MLTGKGILIVLFFPMNKHMVRVAWIFLDSVAGSSVLAYSIAWLIIPKRLPGITKTTWQLISAGDCLGNQEYLPKPFY